MRHRLRDALDAGDCDLLIAIGGSGVGRSDADGRGAGASAARSSPMASRCSPAAPRPSAGSEKCPSSCCRARRIRRSRRGGRWRCPRWIGCRADCREQPVTLPLARKIASSVGIAEIVLLERDDGAWMPLAVGEMSLETIARADAWLAVPGGSEGYAAGTPVDAYMLRD